jgi:hypothetical protein
LSLFQGFSENQAATDAAHVHPDLRGRTYAIPFEQVWQGALGVAGGGLSRWSLIRSDDVTGHILAEIGPALLRPAADVLIKVTLDSNAQTRVDLSTSSRTERWDLGASHRRVVAFFRALDRFLQVRDGQILDPMHPGTSPGGG